MLKDLYVVISLFHHKKISNIKYFICKIFLNIWYVDIKFFKHKQPKPVTQVE